MANIAHPACTRSELQLTIHLLGPFGAAPAKKMLYPFLRRAFHPGPPRGTVVVVPTPLPFVSEASSGDPFAFSKLRQPRCMKLMAQIRLMVTL